jgi:hypothetical protein
MVINISGYAVLIDDDMAERIAQYTWHKEKIGYFSAYKKGTGRKNLEIITLHRFIARAKKGEIVDHINGDTLDNRRENLRICKQAENAKNKGGIVKGDSGYRCVFFDKNKKGDKKYRAYILVNFKKIYLGSFITAEDASAAYENAAKKYFGEYYRPIELREKKEIKPSLPYENDHVVYFTHDGKTLNITQWCKELGISHAAFYRRLELGWTFEKAITTPKNGENKRYEYNGECLTLSEWSRRTGIAPNILLSRIKSGWDMERALTVEVKKRSKKEIQ